jgi:hypothetical protein
MSVIEEAKNLEEELPSERLTLARLKGAKDRQ